MTRIVNRYSVLMGAIFLILCGFCPKLMSVISIMPPAVLGGVVCYMFGTILVGGVELLVMKASAPGTRPSSQSPSASLLPWATGKAPWLACPAGSPPCSLPPALPSRVQCAGAQRFCRRRKRARSKPSSRPRRHCRRSGGFERRYRGGDHTGIHSDEGLIAPLLHDLMHSFFTFLSKKCGKGRLSVLRLQAVFSR